LLFIARLQQTSQENDTFFRRKRLQARPLIYRFLLRDWRLRKPRMLAAFLSEQIKLPSPRGISRASLNQGDGNSLRSKPPLSTCRAAIMLAWKSASFWPRLKIAPSLA
jgi:hypothetical protein